MDAFSRKKNISLGRLKGALKFFGSTLYAHIAEMSDHRLGEAPVMHLMFTAEN